MINLDWSNNPNMSLTCNFTTGAQTNSTFGTISGAQVQARRTILSAVSFRQLRDALCAGNPSAGTAALFIIHTL